MILSWDSAYISNRILISRHFRFSQYGSKLLDFNIQTIQSTSSKNYKVDENTKRFSVDLN